MKLRLIALLFLFQCTGCASFWAMFDRHDEVKPPPEAAPVVQEDNSHKRTTRKSLEEQSMLGEESGSLWVGRGQASYLFTNNNFRIIGDVVNVKLEGYPKEQIQTKANVISKLLAEILHEQKQEIKLKQDEIKKQLEPVDPKNKPAEPNFLQRGLASVSGKPIDEKKGPDPDELNKEMKKTEKDLEKIGKEEEEIKDLQKQREFPIKSVVARIVEIQKDGNYKLRSETPFLIGKREYKLLVMGLVRREEFEEKGISAEILVDPVFDIISEKKSEEL